MPVDFYGNVKSTRLRPVSGKSFERMGGLVVSSRHIDDYWRATMRTPIISREDRSSWLAWLDDCVDMNRRVDFVHPTYRYPIGFTPANWPLAFDPTLVSVTDLRHIVVSGLEVGMRLPKWTRLSIEQGDYVCYRRITEEVASVSSAISESLTIGPRIYPGVFAPGATVRLVNPKVRLMVVPESWEADEDVDLLPLEFEMEESLT